MKKLNSEIKRTIRLFFQMSIFLMLASCSNLDETTFEEMEVNGVGAATDAWICDMKSFDEDLWRYQLYLDSNGDYIAVSDSRILKVSKDGILNSMILLTYPDDDNFAVRIYNDKIYRFHTENEFQDFDPTIPNRLQIYDFNFSLISEHVLDTGGLIYDVEIENDNTFGMLVYDVDKSTMTLKKINVNNGTLSEIILSTTGTSPTNLHIAESGNYFCTASSTRNNIMLLDNDLNLIWANEFDQYLISDAKYVSGEGIFITGRVATSIGSDRPAFTALIDLNGNEKNSLVFNPNGRWSPMMEINQDRICLVETEPESGLNMLFTILDFDLNIKSTLDIPGNVVQSDIIVNELGSFSFVYGITSDPNSPDFFPPVNTRIFKFDGSYTLPTNTIIQ